MRELSLFSGMGGGIYGSMILGWQTVAYVEKEEYPRKVIEQRIKDGWFEPGEIYGDIKDFNKDHAYEYAGKIDIITGGFPCQPHSVAGKRKSTSDERYLWDEIVKTISIVRPSRLFFENVRGILTDHAIVDVFTRIESLGYALKPPLVLGSFDCGNIHKRERVWIYATDTRCERVQRQQPKTVARQSRLSRRENIRSIKDLLHRPDIPTPLFFGVDDELPHWKQQLKAIGNGQDPIVMATAYLLLDAYSGHS